MPYNVANEEEGTLLPGSVQFEEKAPERKSRSYLLTALLLVSCSVVGYAAGSSQVLHSSTLTNLYATGSYTYPTTVAGTTGMMTGMTYPAYNGANTAAAPANTGANFVDAPATFPAYNGANTAAGAHTTVPPNTGANFVDAPATFPAYNGANTAAGAHTTVPPNTGANTVAHTAAAHATFPAYNGANTAAADLASARSRIVSLEDELGALKAQMHSHQQAEEARAKAMAEDEAKRAEQEAKERAAREEAEAKERAAREEAEAKEEAARKASDEAIRASHEAVMKAHAEDMAGHNKFREEVHQGAHVIADQLTNAKNGLEQVEKSLDSAKKITDKVTEE